MSITLELRQELSIDPWYWNLSNEEMRNAFKEFLREGKGYCMETPKNHVGTMVQYIDAIEKIAKASGVSMSFVGVNIDKFLAKCDKDNKIQIKALKLYKKFVS